MGLNLHRVVRGVVTAVNPDTNAAWRRNTGSTTSPSGRRTPEYTETPISVQVQPVSGDELKQVERLNLQGILRKVYAYGDIQGVVRPDLRGGDLLTFPFSGEDRSWLVVHVLETWTPDAAGWCSVIVALQDEVVP